jgi:peptidoglycan/xylan/chitin deacetylase (PgdA/CDA1 family)
VAPSEIALTVDVEGDFGTASLRGVDEVLPALLDALEARSIAATLFVVGDVARARPGAIRGARDRGHAVASHSMTHAALSRSTPERRRRELADSRAVLEDVTGVPCTGFRAPYFDLSRGLGPLLEETGYRWSSSKAPFSPVALYRHALSTRGEHTLAASAVREFPVPGVFGLPIPEGLSYRRLFRPLLALRPAVPRVFYLHPYELLDAVREFALPWWMRPLVTAGHGRAAAALLWDTVDAWRAAGARFVTLPAGDP